MPADVAAVVGFHSALRRAETRAMFRTLSHTDFSSLGSCNLRSNK